MRLCKIRKPADGAGDFLLATIIRSSVQRYRGRFPEERPVLDREAAKLAEPVVAGNFGYSDHPRIGAHQGPSREVHPSQPKIADWADAEMLLATQVQRALRCTRRGADLRQIGGLIMICHKKFFKPRHERRMAANAETRLGRNTLGPTTDHRVDQRLFQRPRYPWMREFLRRRLCQANRLRVKAQESHHELRSRTDDARYQWYVQFLAGQSAPSCGEIRNCQRHASPVMGCKAPAMHRAP